jgi:hypothetical protein
MKIATVFVVLSALATLTGCSTYAAARYSISADNVATLRSFRGQQIGVGPFTAVGTPKSEITCRAVGPIKTPDGETFEQFVRKALIDEMTIAEVYAPAAPVTLTGRLDRIDFSSTTDAAWDIAVAIMSSNGKSLSVTERYPFKSSYVAETACNQAAQALMPAVQNLVGKIVHHPEFPALTR